MTSITIDNLLAALRVSVADAPRIHDLKLRRISCEVVIERATHALRYRWPSQEQTDALAALRELAERIIAETCAPTLASLEAANA